MPAPTPAIPSFTDGQLLAAAPLNALASNIQNLYNYNQSGFKTQRDCVIAVQNTPQTLNGNVDTLVTFNTTTVNTNNMWIPSQPTQLTVQVAGIYWIFGQIRWPVIASATFPANWGQANLLQNGTNPNTNTISMNVVPFTTVPSGSASQVGCIANLAAGATLYLDAYPVWTGSAALQTSFGSSYLGAVFLTPST
jgi:hypothetical protein